MSPDGLTVVVGTKEGSLHRADMESQVKGWPDCGGGNQGGKPTQG